MHFLVCCMLKLMILLFVCSNEVLQALHLVAEHPPSSLTALNSITHCSDARWSVQIRVLCFLKYFFC